MVDGERLRGVHRRVAVSHAGDQHPQSDAGRHTRQGGEIGHCLEGLARPIAVHRLEVVEAPDPVEAQLFGEPDAANELVPWQPLLGDV